MINMFRLSLSALHMIGQIGRGNEFRARAAFFTVCFYFQCFFHMIDHVVTYRCYVMLRIKSHKIGEHNAAVSRLYGYGS